MGRLLVPLHFVCLQEGDHQLLLVIGKLVVLLVFSSLGNGRCLRCTHWEDGERVGVSTTSSPTAAWSRMGSYLLLPLPPRPLPPRPLPPATRTGVFFVGFTDTAFPLVVGMLNNYGVSRLFSTSIWRQARHAVPFYGHSFTFIYIWMLPFAGCALNARCMRASCAGHSFSAPATRTLCTRWLFFNTCALYALCMRTAYVQRASNTLCMRCQLATSFFQILKKKVRRTTTHWP